MKPININRKNFEKIDALLASVNGRASKHTLNYAFSVQDLAEQSTKHLNKLGLKTQASQTGCVVEFTSGGAIPTAYSYPRHTTWLRIERKVSGWFLNSVERTTTYGNADRPVYILAPEHDAICVEGFRKGWTVRT